MKAKISTVCVAVAWLSLPLGTITGLTGCAGDQYNRSTGEYIDDKGISTRVKGALNDNPEYKFNDVNVTSFKGTVQLSGFVSSTDQKKKAGEIAEHVSGVHGVENNITIKE